MAAETDYTTAHLAAIRRAIAKGERTVQMADRSTTYRTMEELFQAEEHIASSLASATVTRSKQSFGVASKGF